MTALDYLRVLADWNRDGEYSHPLSDITGRVISAEWHYGFDAPGQLMAPPAGGTVVLDNSDGAFFPDRPGSLYGDLLRPDVLIQFQHTGSVLRVGGSSERSPNAISVLRIVDTQLAPGAFGKRTCILTLGDWHSELMAAIYDPPLTLTAYTGNMVATALGRGLVPLSYAGQYMIIGASELDVDTRLYEIGTGYISTAQGSTAIPYTGNNIDRGNGVNLYSFLEEMCVAEMDGRFWIETFMGLPGTPPRPRWRFLGRTSLAEQYDPSVLFTLPASRFTNAGSDYEYGRTICNSLEVTMYPRVVGAAGTALAEYGSALRLRAGDVRQMTLRYRDPAYPDASCTGIDIVPLVAGSDYTANELEDGSGADRTANLGIALDNRTNAAFLTLTNNGASDLYVTKLAIRGTPLTARQPVTVSSVDAPSVHQYGYQRKSMTIAGVDDQELVQAYADAFVQRYKDPIARYRRVTFTFPEDASDPLYRPALILPLAYGGVRIVDDWVEDPAGARMHWVAGAQHSVTRGGGWAVSWFLEDYRQSTYWTVGDTAIGLDGRLVEMGFSRLDVSTRLAF